jgi:hypothetical protein
MLKLFHDYLYFFLTQSNELSTLPCLHPMGNWEPSFKEFWFWIIDVVIFFGKRVRAKARRRDILMEKNVRYTFVFILDV